MDKGELEGRKQQAEQLFEKVATYILTDSGYTSTIKPYKLDDKEFKEQQRREREKKLINERRRNARRFRK